MDERGPSSGIGRQQRIAVGILLLCATLLLAGVVGVVIWSLGREAPPAPVTTVNYDSYRPAWESAMAKAGVEADFPTSPVELEELQPSGMHPFSATFTPEELSALLTIYRFRYTSEAGDIWLQWPKLGFPSPGQASIRGQLVLGRTAYNAQASAPVTYSDGQVDIDADQAQLVAEGFTVGGENRAKLLGMVGSFVEALIEAAPGLTVESAEIVEDGLRVEGMAPAQLRHPS